MSKSRRAQQKPRLSTGKRPAGLSFKPRRALSLAVLLLGGVGFFTTLVAGVHWPDMIIGPGPAARRAAQDYASFSHRSEHHASLDCAACHHRADNSARPAWPVHKDCTGCHLAQFVTPDIPMCVICHTDVNGSDAPLKGFPENFKESFNVKFDHAQHMQGGARPREGCVLCHDRSLRRGIALSIPAGLLSAHSQCYTCHTPGSHTFAGREMASCGTCHDRGRYAPTGSNARAFRAGFSHAQHGARVRLGCTDCHTLSAGLPQSRQVSAPATAEHFNAGRAMSCMTCHDGKRAFGGDLDFKSCRRCHTGPTFRLPG